MPRQSPFQTDIVEVFVGPDKARFTAHKSILMKAPYFRASLSGNFSEGDSHVVTLPEEDPRAFLEILNYLYSGEVTRIGEETDPTVGVYALATLVVLTWVSADSFNLENLSNKLMDEFRAFGLRKFFHANFIIANFSNLPEDCLLREYIILQIAHVFRMDGWDSYVDKCADITDWVDEGGLMVRKVFALLSSGKDIDDPSLAEDNCRWHRHTITPKCANI